MPQSMRSRVGETFRLEWRTTSRGFLFGLTVFVLVTIQLVAAEENAGRPRAHAAPTGFNAIDVDGATKDFLKLPGGYRDGFQKVIFEEVGPARSPAVPDLPSGDRFDNYDDNSVVAENAEEPLFIPLPYRNETAAEKAERLQKEEAEKEAKRSRLRTSTLPPAPTRAPFSTTRNIVSNAIGNRPPITIRPPTGPPQPAQRPFVPQPPPFQRPPSTFRPPTPNFRPPFVPQQPPASIQPSRPPVQPPPQTSFQPSFVPPQRGFTPQPPRQPPAVPPPFRPPVQQPTRPNQPPPPIVNRPPPPPPVQRPPAPVQRPSPQAPPRPFPSTPASTPRPPPSAPTTQQTFRPPSQPFRPLRPFRPPTNFALPTPAQSSTPPPAPLPRAPSNQLRTGVCTHTIYYKPQEASVADITQAYSHFAVVVSVDQCARTCHEFQCGQAIFDPTNRHCQFNPGTARTEPQFCEAWPNPIYRNNVPITARPLAIKCVTCQFRRRASLRPFQRQNARAFGSPQSLLTSPVQKSTLARRIHGVMIKESLTNNTDVERILRKPSEAEKIVETEALPAPKLEPLVNTDVEERKTHEAPVDSMTNNDDEPRVEAAEPLKNVQTTEIEISALKPADSLVGKSAERRPVDSGTEEQSGSFVVSSRPRGGGLRVHRLNERGEGRN